MPPWLSELLASDLSGVVIGGVLTLLGTGVSGSFGAVRRRRDQRDQQRLEQRAAVQELVFAARTLTPYRKAQGVIGVPKGSRRVERAVLAAELTVVHKKVRGAVVDVIDAINSEPSISAPAQEWADYQAGLSKTTHALMAAATDAYS